jgi:chromosome segregation ATPase
VESALEKAQEVMNDQYVTIHDLQLQVNTALEGIRILNEHIQEYDKRVDGLQTSTQTFFAEVQAENRKQHDVICRALDELHDKLAADIAAKTAIPKSPVPVNFPSQNLDSPQMGGFSPTIPNLPSIGANPMAPIVQRLDGHSKSIQELNAHIATLHQRGVDQQRQIQTVMQIPSSVQRFCDDVSARLHTSQNEHTSLTERVNAIDLAMNSIKVTLTTHITNVNNNFGETATHMDSVKKRFGEHRNQLENLITGWRETLSAMDQLEGKYDALKKFLQNKIIPTIVKVQMSSPDLLKAGNSANDSLNQNNNGTSDDATQNRLLTTMAAATATGSGERRLPPAEGGGGAFNPIEL